MRRRYYISGFRNARTHIGGDGRSQYYYTLARHVGGVSTHVRNEKKNCNLEIALHTHTESTSDVIRIINIDGRTHIIYTGARTEALFGIIRHIIIYKYNIILYMMDYFDRSCGIQQHVYAYIWYRYNKHDECVMRKKKIDWNDPRVLRW